MVYREEQDMAKKSSMWFDVVVGGWCEQNYHRTSTSICDRRAGQIYFEIS